MRRPRFDILPRINQESYARGMHPNPHYYKYYWWVFWRLSPIDGHAFLSDKYRVNTSTAMDMLFELSQSKEPWILYNRRYPRIGDLTPFNSKSNKWIGTIWSPDYRDDKDSPSRFTETFNHK